MKEGVSPHSNKSRGGFQDVFCHAACFAAVVSAASCYNDFLHRIENSRIQKPQAGCFVSRPMEAHIPCLSSWKSRRGSHKTCAGAHPLAIILSSSESSTGSAKATVQSQPLLDRTCRAKMLTASLASPVVSPWTAYERRAGQRMKPEGMPPRKGWNRVKQAFRRGP